MTRDELERKQQEVYEVRKLLHKLDTVQKVIGMLEGECMIDVIPVNGASEMMGPPIHLTMALSDQEQAVMCKGIQAVLTFAEDRLNKEVCEA